MGLNNTLEETILLRQEIDGSIRLALVADEARDDEGSVLAGDGGTGGVNVRNVQLNAGVVLRTYQTVGVRAKQSQRNEEIGLRCPHHLRGMYRSTFLPSSFSIVVLEQRCYDPRGNKDSGLRLPAIKKRSRTKSPPNH